MKFFSICGNYDSVVYGCALSKLNWEAMISRYAVLERSGSAA
jgi:hypothetical protein